MSFNYNDILRTRNQNRRDDQQPPADGAHGAVPDQGKQDVELGAGAGVGRACQRNAAKSKAGSGARRSRSEPNAGKQEDVFYDDDEEPDIGKTLHARDGELGFVTSKGFMSATNFLVDIESQVFSEKYSIKGSPCLFPDSKSVYIN